MDGKKNNNRFISLVKRLFLEGDSRAKLFFVLLSIFLWFLIKLSNEGYRAVIEFPVNYQNLPEDKTLAEEPPKTIRVSMTGQGFNLLKYKLRGLKSIDIDVSRLKREGDSTGRSFWLTNQNAKFVEAQLGSGTTVLSISPDTVLFNFSLSISKKVPIVLDLDKQYSNLISLYQEPQLNVDSILVKGPKKFVNEINEIKTKKIVLTADEDSISVTSKLVLPANPHLSFSATQVKAKFIFTTITEGTFLLPIEVVNAPEEFQLITFPKEVTIKFQVPIRDYEKINDADFRVYADYAKIATNSEARYLPIAIESYPAYVKYVNYEPKRVEYILTKE